LAARSDAFRGTVKMIFYKLDLSIYRCYCARNWFEIHLRVFLLVLRLCSRFTKWSDNQSVLRDTGEQ